SDQAAEHPKAEHLSDMAGLKQIVREIKHQKRLHPVIGKAFPEFRCRKPAKPRGMADERPVAGGCRPRAAMAAAALALLFQNGLAKAHIFFRFAHPKCPLLLFCDGQSRGPAGEWQVKTVERSGA